MLQYLDPYQYLHVYLRVSYTKNNNTLGNVRHSKSRDNNFKLPPRAATFRFKRRHGRPLCRSRRPPLAVPQAGDSSRPPYNHVEGRSTAEFCAVGWRLMAVIQRVWACELAVHPRNKKCPISDLGGV